MNRFPGKVRWQWVDSLRPSRGSLRGDPPRRDPALEAPDPRCSRSRTLGGAAGQRAVVPITTPLDGILSLGLNVPRGADYDLALRDRAGRLLGVDQGSGRHEGLNFTVCGQARVNAVVSRVSGGGRFKLTVRRP